MQETVNIPRDHLKELVECLEAATSDLDLDAPLVRDSELAIQDAKNVMEPGSWSHVCYRSETVR